MNQESRKKERNSRALLPVRVRTQTGLARFSCSHLYHDSKFLIRDSTQKGFTLVEMIISIGLFSVVMVSTVGVLLSVIDADKKAQGLKIAVDNLSLSLDSMTRNIRTGTDYAKFPAPNSFSCDDNNQGGVTGISFLDHSGVYIVYKLVGNSIRISKDGGVNFSPLTGSEVTVNRLCFYVNGSADTIQPSILVTIGGYATVAGLKDRTKSRFDIQSLIVQRRPGVLYVI